MTKHEQNAIPSVEFLKRLVADDEEDAALYVIESSKT